MSLWPHLLLGCALERECRGLRGHLPPACRLLATGLGARRTRQTLEATFRTHPPGLFIFTGSCGQLDPRLEMGEVVLAREWCFGDGTCSAPAPPLLRLLEERGWPLIPRGVTVQAPVLKARSREALHRDLGAAVVDMESAAALAVAQRHGVEALALKVITDTSRMGPLQFWRSLEGNLERLAARLLCLLRELEEAGWHPTTPP